MRVMMQQCLRPNGRRVDSWCDDVPDALQGQVEAIRECGLTITCEVLTTGHVSLALEHPRLGDFDGQLCRNTPEGSGMPMPNEGLVALLTRFNPNDFKQWSLVEDEDREVS